MLPYRLVSDYRDNEKLRHGFNKLFQLVFRFDLEDYYQKGYWDNHFVCYSLADGDDIISNVSVDEHTLILNGKEYQAIQFSTVMTHPDYRNKGLSAQLMNHVIDKFKNDCQILYLYANDSVLDFYPKFGFKRVQEHQFLLNIESLKPISDQLMKLDMTDKKTMDFVYGTALNRMQISDTFAVKDSPYLTIFHCLYMKNDNVYYDKDNDCIVILSYENEIVHLWDIISKKAVNIEDILSKIKSENSEKVLFHFTPDKFNLDIKTIPYHNDDDVLFIRGISPEFQLPIFRQYSVQA